MTRKDIGNDHDNDNDNDNDKTQHKQTRQSIAEDMTRQSIAEDFWMNQDGDTNIPYKFGVPPSWFMRVRMNVCSGLGLG